MTSSWDSPEFQVKPLRKIAEHSLSVLDLAERHVQTADAHWSSERTLKWLERNEFDAAPLRKIRPYRFIDKSLELDSQPVGEHSQPMDSSVLVSGDLGLAEAVLRLKEHPYYFVLQGESLSGIVTRADLQRPAVSMVLFSMILAAESATNLIIDMRLGESWPQYLNSDSLDRAQQSFEKRRHTSTEVTLLQCLMLRDRLDLLEKCPGVEDLGFLSKTQYRKWKEKVTGVRNSLAHGGTLLHAQPDPVSAIDVFADIRSFMQETWDIAVSSS